MRQSSCDFRGIQGQSCVIFMLILLLFLVEFEAQILIIAIKIMSFKDFVKKFGLK